VPFWRVVELCDRACADPSDCPPRTRAPFEQAILLRYQDDPDCADHVRADSQPHRDRDSYEPRPVERTDAAYTSGRASAPVLGEVLPVRHEEVATVIRTIERVVMPGLPGRLIDLVA